MARGFPTLPADPQFTVSGDAVIGCFDASCCSSGVHDVVWFNWQPKRSACVEAFNATRCTDGTSSLRRLDNGVENKIAVGPLPAAEGKTTHAAMSSELFENYEFDFNNVISKIRKIVSQLGNYSGGEASSEMNLLSPLITPLPHSAPHFCVLTGLSVVSPNDAQRVACHPRLTPVSSPPLEEQRKANVRAAQKEVEEAEDLVRRGAVTFACATTLSCATLRLTLTFRRPLPQLQEMDMESRDAPPAYRTKLQNKMARYKADLDKLKREMGVANDRSQLLGAGGDMQSYEDNQRGRILDTTDRLHQTSDRLANTQRIAAESGACGQPSAGACPLWRPAVFAAGSGASHHDDRLTLLHIYSRRHRGHWAQHHDRPWPATRDDRAHPLQGA